MTISDSPTAENIMPELPSTPLEVLSKVFGYDKFRDGQQAVIDAVVNGQDALVLLPTGGSGGITANFTHARPG